MALQKDITLDSGITLPASYIRISHINMMCGQWMEVEVEIYKDQAARSDGKTPVVILKHRCVEDFDLYFNMAEMSSEGVNGVIQAYEYLKTIPFYAEAISVMDIKV